MAKPKVNGWYGWRPDKPDVRDLRVRVPHPDVLVALPDSVDLRSGFPACYDQGDLGSCTANAIGGCLEFDQRKQGKKSAATPSRLFIYYNERVMEGTVSEDAGAEIRDGIKSVNQLGAPSEKLWPYVIAKFAKKPSVRAYRSATAHQALRYERIDNAKIDNLRAVLASGFPFAFGFTVYDFFESDVMAKTGILAIPSANEGTVGGHAVVGIGYDHAKQMVLVRNSWNTDWGKNGNFWIPYSYITNSDLADDFWVIRQVE
jgi:C1A family cysteine protease